MLFARIYELFPLVCPRCGIEMRIIAFITDAPTASGHLGIGARPKVPQQARGAARCHRKWTFDSTDRLPDTPARAVEMTVRIRRHLPRHRRVVGVRVRAHIGHQARPLARHRGPAVLRRRVPGKWPALMAGGVVSLIPMLVLFLLLEPFLVSGMTSGAVKQQVHRSPLRR
jgi:hypothetical protein